MSVQLLRNTRVFLSTVKTGHATENTSEISVGDDLSFSQSSSSSTIEVSEAGASPTRGTAEFNDSLDPVEWSFSTYLRSYAGGANGETNLKLIPEALLWQGLSSGSDLDYTTEEGVSANNTNTLIKFTDNSHNVLTTLQVYLLIDTIWYHIEDVQVGSASISNEITDIGMTTWSGQGTLLNSLVSEPFDVSLFPSSDICTLNASYIRNKLTILRLKDNVSETVYNIPLTGGSVEFNNNITYLTPSTLSCLDVPIGSYTGAFSVSGTVSAYLNGASNGTATLLRDLLENRSVTNSFELAIIMGGVGTSSQPACVIVIPSAQLGIPSISSGDLIGTEITFMGQGTELGAGDEVFIGMSNNYNSAQVERLISTGDGAPLS
jgi:hypothetical protein